MMSYRSVAAVLGPSINAGVAQIWPPRPGMTPGYPVSLTALCDRFSAAGEALDAFESKGTSGVWKFLERAAVAQTIRVRLVDPALIDQENAGLCGPMSILFELARRDPLEYVFAAAQLFDEGQYQTPGGKTIVAEEELRMVVPPSNMAAVDWLLGASLRDDANIWEDVDRGATQFNGLETMTTPWEMAEWIREVLNLDSDVESCIQWGEMDVLRDCEDAVQKGGVAFLCVHGDVLQKGDGEEDVWFTRRSHYEGWSVVSEPRHSGDDGSFPDHWIVHLGGMQLDEAKDQLILPVWSWASEFTVSGSAEGFGEYLFYGVIGRHK